MIFFDECLKISARYVRKNQKENIITRKTASSEAAGLRAKYWNDWHIGDAFISINRTVKRSALSGNRLIRIRYTIVRVLLSTPLWSWCSE